MRGIDFNKGWKFKETTEIMGIHMNNYEDSTWEEVQIPHDWSIKKPFDKELGEGCTGYLLGGIGWYRKHFVTNKEMENKLVLINFDGIYNRANIYCNGHFIKFHPYGYSPCMIDISKYINPVGEDNVIAVMVDRTRYADSRWYTGSGIYRKVSMHILPKVHIPVWGSAVTTKDVTDKSAQIEVNVKVQNELEENSNVNIKVKILSPKEEIVTEGFKNIEVKAQELLEVKQSFEISNPELWEIYNSKLYKAKITLEVNGKVEQEVETRFGIRTILFDVDKGFFLNGKNTLIKGVCLHHEAGLVGAAVPLDVWKRRLETLKECGCNAIRTAHNPASEDFLDLCDEMGLLVQEEFYDEWDNPKDKRYNGTEQKEKIDYITRGHAEFFKDYAKEDLQNVIKRDINHPCIFQWSIGNEIEWTYPKYNIATGYFGADANGNYFWTLPPYSIEKIRENIQKLPREQYEVGDTAKKLSKWTKEMDDTRPVIANCILPSASYESGYTDALDIVGFSYRQVVYEYAHKHYHDKPVMGTENVAQWHEWKHVLEKEYISGIFLWTGIDYIGEAGRDKWPRKATRSGLLDLAGFKKPSYYMFKSLWRDEASVYIATQTLEKSLYKLNGAGELEEKEKDGWKTRLWVWHDVNEHWNYKNDEMVVVEVYSNCDSISLYLNDSLVSKKYLKDFEDHIYKWVVPFASGELKAVGVKDGEIVEEVIKTAKECAKVSLSCDKTKISVNPDEVVHIVAQLQDEEGNPIKHIEDEIVFDIKGEYKLLGVDNGDVDSVQNYVSTSVVTHNGKCLLIIQGKEKGIIDIRASCRGKYSDSIQVSVE